MAMIRKLTQIPGPKSVDLIARKNSAVPRGAHQVAPKVGNDAEGKLVPVLPQVPDRDVVRVVGQIVRDALPQLSRLRVSVKNRDELAHAQAEHKQDEKTGLEIVDARRGIVKSQLARAMQKRAHHEQHTANQKRPAA